MGLKTRNNNRAVDKFLSEIKDEQMRIDCLAVPRLMGKLTEEPTVAGNGYLRHHRGLHAGIQK